MLELWHNVREVPEGGKWVLVAFPDGAFALERLASDKCWLYILEKSDPETKWMYCDDLTEREYPQTFGYDFLRQLETDCFFASQKLATKPAKSKKYQNAAGSLLGASLELSNIIWDFEKK